MFLNSTFPLMVTILNVGFLHQHTLNHIPVNRKEKYFGYVTKSVGTTSKILNKKNYEENGFIILNFSPKS